jgi:6-phosphogluconolactonase (cycloisomerase 2 family)
MTSLFTRRHALLCLALTAAFVGTSAFAKDDDDDGLREGKLFISTNAVAGNAVQVYARNANGPASLLSTVATHGIGTGAGLGSQGALTLSTSGRYLLVVNAGSNSVSTFKLDKGGLVLVSTVASGGTRPISVAENDGVVYVLHAPDSGIGNSVVGFRNEGGVLKPLAGGVRALADSSAPAQVAFDTDGDVLVVSEKNATQLVSYSVRKDGLLSASFAMAPSPGAVPFGFGITRRNVVVVSEAGTSSASSYRIAERTEPLLQLVSPAVANGQAAACWVAVTPNGKLAFTANAGASNISSYAIDAQGKLTLLAAQAGYTSNNGALDMAVTPDGKQLHVFASRAPQQIVSFTISANGSLTKIGTQGGVIPGSAGLAAN